MPLIQIETLTKSYEVENRVVHALQGIDLSVEKGEFLALVGRSGCGKSTLLNLLGGLDTPSGGSLRVGGQEISGLDEKGLTLYRRETVGIVFQFFNLMPLLSALENAALPALLAGKPKKATLERAKGLLGEFFSVRRAAHVAKTHRRPRRGRCSPRGRELG